ncbi:hypothetical protein WUBG_00696 [Wuchereria bancrofti]|uniref:Uncharacterized protein n=1 Tax=Wuchereria bancrofti TaxID=6293 RepID=J9FFH4_WUCBA|nr:hypothetical protein WUBG_00696 [Wuchereria bancrofti]VDM07021.1 unnamed protein product [Wuchereria bancrofti]
MRSSLLKLCAKVNQATLQVSRKNLFRICGTIVVAEIVFAAYVEEFALPTPDMVYDFHMRFSREFADFAVGNKYGARAFRHTGDK